MRMSPVEKTLASYLSQGEASLLKALKKKKEDILLPLDWPP